MRRADRLFQLLQILRRRRLVTAQALADELEVSRRTVYRDISDLMAAGVPVEGEAGLGYILRDGYDLPPLMFTLDELEALAFGARFVSILPDSTLSKAAIDALNKVAAVVPPAQRGVIDATSLCVPSRLQQVPHDIDLAELRRAVRERRRIDIVYIDGEGGWTRRTVWPLAIVYYGPVWLLTSWCELRNDFRSFRLDRIDTVMVTELVYPPTPGRRLEDFLKRQEGC
ncbi:MAG TPA: YafY family protein [Alphaproteobacteria bacterium]|nr:YafY family protein [Alphaproteobacteria bacterium]